MYWAKVSTWQKMLDFDFLSWREPSLLAFIDETNAWKSFKMFYWNKEILIKCYKNCASLPEEIKEKADNLLNFASFRSAYKATIEAMESGLFKNITIIAEWIPERDTLKIIEKNKDFWINIIGPSTVWAMTAWEFRIWNTWGHLWNIVESKLFKKWSVWFVSKSWGMSNEMRRVISYKADWITTSVAIWWDKYNIMTFKDVILNLEKDESTKMIVMLWEIGGKDELEIAEMIKSWEIKKPVCAYCIWTIWEKWTWDIQFWHAWAKSDSEKELASYKNKVLKESWAFVPNSFSDFWDVIEECFLALNIDKNNVSDEEINTIKDKVNIIENRRKSNFTSTVSDERWEELTYNKKLISDFTKKQSIANVISNLWFKRDMPDYWEEFINTAVILLADHGPAVSWATNAIVTARWWNDLKSSLISGLATIWPRFWWAIDWAWKYFFEAVNAWEEPLDFVKRMKKNGINIPWIWHKVKSKFNPDKRCEIMLEVSKKFPNNKYLSFALEVEKITLDKLPNLILNVDWMIACMMLDLMENIWIEKDEIQKYIDAWVLNAMFILSRSIGFIGHIIDQKTIDEGLYRTPWNDILYK